MAWLRHGYVRTATHLPTEAEQRHVLEAAGVEAERVEVDHTKARRKKLDSPRPLLGLPAVISRCRVGDEIAVSRAAILAGSEPSVRLALVEIQAKGAHVFDCDAGQAVRTFGDVEAFIARAKRGWTAGRAAYARQFGRRLGAPKKKLLVPEDQARAWWHDEDLTKAWVSEQTGASERTLFNRFGHRTKGDAKNG